MYNIRRLSSNVTIAVHYETGLVSLYTRETGWEDKSLIVNRVGGTSAFAVRESFDNFLSFAARVTGLVLMAVGMLVNLVALALLHLYREADAIKLHEPVRLAVLCGGSAMINAAIFFFSWDEGANWNHMSLSIVCGMSPWIFFLGQSISFHTLHQMALYGSLSSGMGGLPRGSLSSISFFACTLFILLLWSVVDPYVWVRRDISVIPAETYGECTSGERTKWYISPLVVLSIGHCMLAGSRALKSFRAHNRGGNHASIIYACYGSLQCWGFGVPMILLVGTSSVDAAYLARLCLTWILGVASISTVVWTPLYTAMRQGRPRLERFRFSQASMLMFDSVSDFDSQGNRQVRSGWMSDTSREYAKMQDEAS